MMKKWIVGLLVGVLGFSSFGGEFDGEFNVPNYTGGSYKTGETIKATVYALSGSQATFRVEKTDSGAFSKSGVMRVKLGDPEHGNTKKVQGYQNGVSFVDLSFDLKSPFDKGDKKDYYCTSRSTDGDEYDVGPISVYRRVDAPSRPTVTSTSSTSISLSWNTESEYTKYILYVRKPGNDSQYIVTGTSKVVTGLDPDTTYYFKLMAQGIGGNNTRSESYSSEQSARTSSETVTCATPPSCSVPPSDSDGAYRVGWGESLTSGVTYKLYEKKNNGDWSYVTSKSSLRHDISGKSSGTYTYRVKATKSGCTDSGWRTSGGCVVSISSVVATPSSCSVPSADSDGVYTVNWDASSTGGASYRLEERKNSESWSHVTSGTSQSCSITGKSDGTYTYRVKATKSGYTDSSWRNSGGCVVSIASSDTTPPTFNSVNLDGHSDGGAISIEVNERLNFSGTISDNVSLEKVSMVISRAGENETVVFSTSPSNPYSLSSNYFQPTAGGHYIVGLWGKDTSDNTDRYAWSVEVSDSSAPDPVDTLYGVNADPHEKWRRFSGITQTALLGGNASHNLTPAELIYYSAKENNINPVLLIAKLQDEMGLIKTIYSDVVLAKKMKRATGYGCLDGGDLDSWYGFYPQLVSCTYQFSLSRTRGMSFQEAYESYTTGSGKYSGFVSGIYNWVAAEMNTIAGTSFDTTPTSGSGTGYYNDFKESVSIAHIQSLLEQHVGRLKNEELFSSTSSGGTPPVQTGQPVFFSQKDPAWRNTILADGPFTIGSDGCAITCVSMLYNNLIGLANPPNPAEMNLWQKNNDGFNSASWVRWWVSDDYDAGLTIGTIDEDIDDWAALRSALDDGDWCILRVLNSEVTHFVLAYAYTGGAVNDPASYRILDPIEESFNPNLTMAKYGAFSRRYPYSGNFSQGGVTPPEIISPEANEVGVPLAVACSWLSGIEGASFRVQIATGVSQPSWSSVNGFTTSTSSSTAVPLNIGLPMQDAHAFMWTNGISGQRDPQPETDYWMSVKIFQPEVGSTYSVPVHFKTTIASPSVTAPANNATLTSSPIQASWTTTSGVTASRIQIAEDKSEWTKAYGFTSESDPSDRVVVNANTGATKTYSWQSGSTGSHQGPESGKSYYLTVRSFKPNTGSSVYSEPIQFTYQTQSVSRPSAQTLAASQIGTTSVRLNGEVTSDGGSAITSRGFYFSTDDEVTTGDPSFDVSGTLGEFQKDLSGLTPNSQYWYRAFAYNDEGGVWGLPTQTFTTRDVTTPTYTLVVNSGTGDGASYTEGQVVSISADAPPSGKVFDRWTGDTSAIASVAASSTTVTMPGANVTVSATYKDSGGGTEVNDSFADAIRLTGNSGQTTGSTTDATKESGEPAHAGTTGAASIWWTWVPSANTHVTFDTIGSDFDTVLAVYTGSSVAGLTEIVSADDGSGVDYTSKVEFDAIQGVTYCIAVDGYNEARKGSVVLNWATSSATTYTLVVNSGTGDGTSYTEGQVVSISADTPPSGKVFDRWTGDTSAIATVTASSTTVTMPSANVIVSATYKDSAASKPSVQTLSASQIESTSVRLNGDVTSDGGAEITLRGFFLSEDNDVTEDDPHWTIDGTTGVFSHMATNLNPNSQYWYLAIAGNAEGGTLGNLMTFITAAETTTYALAVSSGTGDGASYTEGQIVSISADTPPSGKVFDRWTGDTSAVANVTASSTTVTMPGANVTVSATYKDSGGGTEVNDSFADAIRLTGNSGQTTGSTSDATKESGEPAHAGKTGAASIWWTWVPSANTHVTFDTIGSDFDTVLAVYTGSSVAGLTEIVSADDGSGVDYTSKVEFDAIQGVTYCIAVDGYNEYRKGAVVLNWATSSATTYTLVVNSGTGDGTSYTAGQRISISADAPPSGKVFDRWTGDTSTMTNVTASSVIFVMPDRNATISATYRDVTTPTYTLVVNSGTGDGTSYTEGQVVSISANTPPSGKVFDRWTGDTSTIANVTASSTTVTMPAQNITVSSTYRDSGGGSRHFEEVSGNPADPSWDIYLAGATLDGSALGAGDEVAIYDGSTLVGSFVLTGTLTDAQKFNNTLKAFSTLDSGAGYQAGSSYQFRCWDTSAGIERSGTVSLSNPSGDAYTGTVFPSAQSPYSIATLTFVTTHFPEVSGNPADPTWDIYLAGATLNGSDLEAGDEIAIYDGSTLVGSFALTGTLTDAQKFNNTLKAFSTLDSGAGYQAGHAYRFICWDQSAAQEHSGSVQLNSGYTGATFPVADGEYSVATLMFGVRTCEVSLRSGYQFVSLNVTPDPAGMLTVLSDVQDNLSIVKDSSANTIRKIGPNWINGIGDWASSEGYLLKMNASDTLSVTGIPVSEDTPIDLRAGYQFITYLPTADQDALIVLADVLDNLSIVKDSNANTIRKIGPNWINGIGDMAQGEGYLVKMNDSDTLRYAPQTQGAPLAMAGILSEPLGDEPEDERHFPEVSGNPADPTWDIYLNEATVNSVDLEPGDELAIYDGSTLVGSFVFSETLTDENWFDNVLKAFSTLDDGDGYAEGNSYTVKMWDVSTSSEYVATVEFVGIEGGYSGSTFPEGNNPYSIMMLSVEVSGSPDLTASLSPATKTVEPGATVSFDVTTQNIGLGDAETNFDTVLFMSATSNFQEMSESELEALEEAEVEFLSGLSAGGSQTDALSFTAPSEEGTYYVIAKADEWGGITESDENNNWSSVATLVVEVASVPQRTITMTSAHGDYFVGEGTHDEGSAQTCAVYSPWQYANGTQYVCNGWTMNHAPKTGGGNTLRITELTNDVSLTWHWATNVWLDTEVSENGSVNVSDGWKALGSSMTNTAAADANHHFTGWSGTTSGCTIDGDEIIIPMDQARTIAASFEIDSYPVTFDLDGKGTRSGGGTTNQSIDHGSAATAPSVLANTGWRFLGWNVAFGNITGSLTVTAQYVEEFTLTVSSAKGNPSPETGVYTNGSVVNCSVETAVTNDANTVRSRCAGWQMPGHAPSSGSGNSFSMTVADDANLTWLWSTDYWLNTETNGNGSVDVSDGWNVNGAIVDLMATPADGADFMGWSGDVPVDSTMDNPLSVTMDQARTVTANFVALPDLMLTNALYTSNTYLIGSSLAVSVVETNRGAASAGAFSLVGVLSTNAVWDNVNNIVLGTNTTASLAAGAGVAVTPIYTVPDAPEGFYYFGLKVDALGAVGESEELNNVWWSSTNDVGVSKAPMWSVNPAETNLPGAAANGVFAVVQTQGLDAAWSAEVSKDWISLVPAFTNGLGDGEVRYSVSENASGTNRDGVIVAAGASFAVSQNTLLPNAPMNPSPANGRVGADRDVTLVWENGGRALDYDVFFGTSEAAMRFASEIVATSFVAGAESDYQIGTQKAGITHYWKVIANNEGGSTTGAVWSFTTTDRMTEDESLNTAGQGLDWENGGDTPWFSQDTEKHDGENAMQSGAIADSQQASMQAVLEGPGVLSFWSKVSSETSDALTFSLNDVPQTNWSGEADWAQTQVAVDFGSQTAKWVYAKDGTGSAGSDAAWVDEVDWAGENKVVFPLSDFSNWVATYIWDYTNQEWIEMGQSFAPTSVEFDNARQDRWYWLCVMEWNGTSWSLAHGSWFKRFEGF